MQVEMESVHLKSQEKSMEEEKSRIRGQAGIITVREHVP